MSGKAQKSTLEPNLLKQISELEKKKENVLPALQMIQKWFRYLPEEYLEFVSREFSVPLSKVVGIATFYSQFTFELQGKHTIRICRGTACHIKGADMIAEVLESEYGFTANDTSDDGEFVLTTVRCLGCCAKAPVMMIDDEVYGNLDREKIIEALESFKRRSRE